jgi:hypothetical protein
MTKKEKTYQPEPEQELQQTDFAWHSEVDNQSLLDISEMLEHGVVLDIDWPPKYG